MKLSEKTKELINKDFDLAIKKMESSDTPEEMLFFFTAIHAVINRAFNIEFSEDLLFVHFILDGAHRTILDRIQHMKNGIHVVKFHDDFGPQLLAISKELRKNFYSKNKRNEALNKIVLLAYSTTGNGYFLLQKGDLPIF